MNSLRLAFIFSVCLLTSSYSQTTKLTLTAKKILYDYGQPTETRDWESQEVHEPMRFAIPSFIKVNKGLSGDHWATLSINTGEKQYAINYQGGKFTSGDESKYFFNNSNVDTDTDEPYAQLNTTVDGIAPGVEVNVTSVKLMVHHGAPGDEGKNVRRLVVRTVLNI